MTQVAGLDIGDPVRFSIRNVQTGEHLFYYVGAYRGMSPRHADEARIRLRKKVYPDGYEAAMYGVTVFPLSRLIPIPESRTLKAVDPA